MVIVDLKEFSKGLRERLETEMAIQTAKEISIEIKSATHLDGTPLSVLEQDKVVFYIKHCTVIDRQGRFLLNESDNAELLKLVDIVAKIVRGEE